VIGVLWRTCARDGSDAGVIATRVASRASAEPRFLDVLQAARSTNPIESTFGTIQQRTKRSKSCLTCVQKNWLRQRGFSYLAKVITEPRFKEGIEVNAVGQAAARSTL